MLLYILLAPRSLHPQMRLAKMLRSRMSKLYGRTRTRNAASKLNCATEQVYLAVLGSKQYFCMLCAYIVVRYER